MKTLIEEAPKLPNPEDNRTMQKRIEEHRAILPKLIADARIIEVTEPANMQLHLAHGTNRSPRQRQQLML